MSDETPRSISGPLTISQIENLAIRAIKEDGLDETDLLDLVEAPLEALCDAADAIRKRCCGPSFEICSIMNVKNGRCGENCAFCAQSAHWNTQIACHSFASEDAVFSRASSDAARGSQRFSLVSSGQRVSSPEVDRACATVRRIRRETEAEVCVSFGLLPLEEFKRLRKAGVTRVHNNLETSRTFFPHICTTHSYDQKIEALRAARAAGMDVCSGGIIGLGETWLDRIELASELRRLKVSSVPINVLNPIPGTPLERQTPLSLDEVRRTFAIFRFALPKAALRLAGGRALLPDAGRACLRAGANAAISGDMLTTSGFDIPSDIRMVKEEGFIPAAIEGSTREEETDE